MEQPKDGNSSLQDLLITFKEHRRGMLVVFLVTVVLVALWTFLQTPLYQVDSRVMVKYGREYIYRPVDLLLKGDVQPMLTFNRDEIINTEIEIFQSSELISEVIRALGLDRLYPKIANGGDDPDKKLARSVEKFKKNLEVNHIKGSGVIKVSFQHPDPDIAVKVVSTLENLFRKRHLEVFKSPRISFLEKQLSIYKDKLIKARDKFEQFKQKNHIVSLEEEKRLLLQEYSRLHTLLVQGKGRVAQLQQKIASLERQLHSIPQNVTLFNQNNIDSAKAQLLSLELQEKDLLQRYTPNSRPVKNIKEKIRLTKEYLAKATRSLTPNQRKGKNYVYQEIQRALVEARADYQGQIADNKALESQLSEIQTRLKNLSEKETVLDILKQSVEVNEASYKNFVKRLEETRILDAMDNQKMVSVAIIERPMKPVKPAKPKKAINLMVGIILGAALSFCYALFYDYFFINNRGDK